eukprot:2838783-Rhodomonas_salina.1
MNKEMLYKRVFTHTLRRVWRPLEWWRWKGRWARWAAGYFFVVLDTFLWGRGENADFNYSTLD